MKCSVVSHRLIYLFYYPCNVRATRTSTNTRLHCYQRKSVFTVRGWVGVRRGSGGRVVRSILGRVRYCSCEKGGGGSRSHTLLGKLSMITPYYLGRSLSENHPCWFGFGDLICTLDHVLPLNFCCKQIAVLLNIDAVAAILVVPKSRFLKFI